MTRNELVQAMQPKLNDLHNKWYGQEVLKDILSVALESIGDALATGEAVSLNGFGRLYAESNAVRFAPTKALVNRIKGGAA